MLERTDDGIRIARALSVQALLAITTRVRGDSTEVEGTLFDARSGRAVGRALRARGLARAPLPLARQIAAKVVGLDPAMLAEGAPYRQSANPEALRQDVQGKRQLERWQLHEAERYFQRAVELDSEFATAHHRLAQTL